MDLERRRCFVSSATATAAAHFSKRIGGRTVFCVRTTTSTIVSFPDIICAERYSHAICAALMLAGSVGCVSIYTTIIHAVNSRVRRCQSDSIPLSLLNYYDRPNGDMRGGAFVVRTSIRPYADSRRSSAEDDVCGCAVLGLTRRRRSLYCSVAHNYNSIIACVCVSVYRQSRSIKMRQEF